MCGIVALYASGPVNQRLYDALLLLQHRGQDAAGICTVEGRHFHMHKGMGLVRDVFRTRNMRDLLGNCGIGQVRYLLREMQRLRMNRSLLRQCTLRYCSGSQRQSDKRRRAGSGTLRTGPSSYNTTSDSEVLLNVFANELALATQGHPLDEEALFKAVSGVHKRVKGSYAVVCMIAGHGVVAFRDPYGIRPLCYGTTLGEDGKSEYMIASESVTLEGSEFQILGDVHPGEAIWIDENGDLHKKQCAEHPVYSPCIFEYVYLARPDSQLDGISVYEARLRLGENLAKEIKKSIPLEDIDVVMPIPDSSRPAAAQLAKALNLPYREGFIKNRYVGRTFIMPGQAVRKKSVRQKLNAMAIEFKDKNVLLVDDSIVRGTTIKEIVRMARQSGAKKVFIASGAPPVRYPNVYGIDMPTTAELIAGDNRPTEQIRIEIGADALVYQTIEGMKEAVGGLNPEIKRFDCSCFDGDYVTGDITPQYIAELEKKRLEAKAEAKKAASDD